MGADNSLKPAYVLSTEVTIPDQKYNKDSIYWFNLEDLSALNSKIDNIKKKIWVPDTSHFLLFALDCLGKYIEKEAASIKEKTFKQKLSDIAPEIRKKIPRTTGGGVLVRLLTIKGLVKSAEIVSVGSALAVAWKARHNHATIKPEKSKYAYVWASNTRLLYMYPTIGPSIEELIKATKNK